MTKYSILILFFLQTTFFCFGQDTIKFESSIHYSSKIDPYRSKDFASKVKYAREDIVFSETHRRIEYCYYYDNERCCIGTEYSLIGDSILQIDDEKWIYKKQETKYFIYRYYEGTYESAYATSLIPLEKKIVFPTTTADRIDTLWTLDTKNKNQTYILHKTSVTGEIYDAVKVDEIPTFLNGDSIKEIKIESEDNCVSAGSDESGLTTFTITSSGRIVNIEREMGFFNFDFCPEMSMNIIRHIYLLGPVKPAKLQGKNVNVKWTINVVAR